MRTRKTNRNSGSVGATRIRLAKLIELHGFAVAPADLLPAQGVYRVSPYVDVQRWYGWGKSNGHPTLPDDMQVSFGSWDTMTECVRHGILVEHEHGAIATRFEVYANEASLKA